MSTAVSERQTASADDMDRLAALFGAGQNRRAAQLARQLIGREPQHGFAWNALGAAIGQLGDVPRAAVLLRRAIHLLPGDAQIRNNLAYLQMLSGLSAASGASARSALALQPDYAEAYLNLAIASNDGRTEPAVIASRRALQLKPASPEARNNLGLALVERERLEAAAASYRLALILLPDFAQAWNNLANLLHRRGERRPVLAAYRRALQLQPAYHQAHDNLATSLLLARQWSAAERHSRIALALRPDVAKAHNGLGNLRHHAGDIEAALRLQRRALDLAPDFAEAQLNLAQILVTDDRLGDAEIAYRQVMAQAADGPGQFAAVELAVLSFLDLRPEDCRHWLEQARGVLQPMALNHKFGAPYWLYLEALLDWQQTQGGRDTAAMAALEVIGDSHCLSAAGLTAVHRGRRRRCRPHWIPGCKQWHLGNPQPNKYKHQLGRILQHLAPGSQVLLLIGEIDCRHDDGISRVLANHPERHADALIDDTVAGYLRHLIAAAAPYRHQLIIGGVPCDNLPPDLLPPAARQQHDRLIGAFNARLASRVQDAGLDFLDLQAATAASGGARHIDHFHLRPDALADALAQHYRPGAVSR